MFLLTNCHDSSNNSTWVTENLHWHLVSPDFFLNKISKQLPSGFLAKSNPLKQDLSTTCQKWYRIPSNSVILFCYSDTHYLISNIMASQFRNSPFTMNHRVRHKDITLELNPNAEKLPELELVLKWILLDSYT